MLYSNELFLRHLIQGIDGPTSCNTGFLGPVRKFLPDVNKMEYNPQFKALPEGEDLVDIAETIMKICQQTKSNPTNYVKWLRLVNRHLILEKFSMAP